MVLIDSLIVPFNLGDFDTMRKIHAQIPIIKRAQINQFVAGSDFF